MQAAKQQSHSCNFSNWKIHELEEAAEAVCHLRIIVGIKLFVTFSNILFYNKTMANML